jgi:hypothetical protein
MSEIMNDHDAGVEAGRARAHALVGELAEFYANNTGIINERASDEEKVEHQKIRKAQENACRYAQYVIKINKVREEEESP